MSRAYRSKWNLFNGQSSLLIWGNDNDWSTGRIVCNGRLFVAMNEKPQPSCVYLSGVRPEPNAFGRVIISSHSFCSP